MRPFGVFSVGANTDYPWMAFAFEFGVPPGSEFEDADIIAPRTSIPAAFHPDVNVNSFHYNANIFFRPQLEIDRLRPYFTAGAGGITARVSAEDSSGFVPDSSKSRHNPAVNMGGGVLVPMTDWMGVTADYRHFVFPDPEVANFDRFTAGVTFFSR
jgi:opacity protein-like surface antigen